MSPENDEEEATVTGFTQTKTGEIAFAQTGNYGTVTFKLSLDVWHGCGCPYVGEVVILSGLTRFNQGWRAMKARRFVLDDESINSQL